MPEDRPKGNIERLLDHLQEDSLAARLVRAYAVRTPQGPIASMNTVLAKCLDEAKAKLDATAD